jgi:hypothetical protein
MFTLARKAVTWLVASFGLYALFDVKKGQALSSVRRTAPPRVSPGFESTNSSASRWRRGRPGSLRSRKF